MKGRLSGAAWLAIISSVACVLAIATVAIILGLLPPDDLTQLGRLAQ